jgi:hypothetical protein
LLLACVVLLGSVQAASASRQPTATERAALSGDFPARCLLIRVSSVDPNWAGTKLTAHPEGWCTDHNFVFDGGSFLRRQGNSWRLVVSASDARGACASRGIPPRVLQDLAEITEAVGCSWPKDARSVPFQSPSGNIVCRIAQNRYMVGGGSAMCQVVSALQGAFVQSGKAAVTGGSISNPSGRILAYGKSLQVGNFGCVSAEAGMTCKNAATHHGFFASRERVRVF